MTIEELRRINELKEAINNELKSLDAREQAIKDALNIFDQHTIDENCHLAVKEYFTIDRNINLISKINSKCRILNSMLTDLETEMNRIKIVAEELDNKYQFLNKLVYTY